MNCFKLLGLLLLPLNFWAQNAGIAVDESVHEYGKVENVYKLQSEFILKNNTSKNLFLMRADVSKLVKIQSSKKSVAVGDTVTIHVFYYPENEGKFNETIKLVTSADGEPLILKIKGEIESIKKDDKTACYYFKKPKLNTNPPTGIFIPKNPNIGITKIDTLPKNKTGWGLDTSTIVATKPPFTLPKQDKPTPTQPGLLNPLKYKPNNIIFLIDVSGSMKDSMKLNLMKISINKLIDNLRENDRVSLVTYRDTFVCEAEAFNGLNKSALKTIVAGLKAKGLTKGSKAIHFSLALAIKYYIKEGNNQIILATDGKFSFQDYDYEKWTKTIGEKSVILSVVALGKDDAALKNLKEIAKKGKGSFIHIKSREKAESAVFDEIEQRSRK